MLLVVLVTCLWVVGCDLLGHLVIALLCWFGWWWWLWLGCVVCGIGLVCCLLSVVLLFWLRGAWVLVGAWVGLLDCFGGLLMLGFVIGLIVLVCEFLLYITVCGFIVLVVVIGPLFGLLFAIWVICLIFWLCLWLLMFSFVW